MDCFQDFCLACDRESSDGPYCSQRCRMADLEKANAELSPPVSPTTSSRTTRYISSAASGYVLAPRFNSTSSTSRQAYMVQSPVQASSYHVTHAAPRSLTPSSSRSSLSSNSSHSSQSANGISEQARLELQTYFSSFDQARAAKRRSSTR